MKKKLPYIVFFVMLAWHMVLFAQERFPRPEFTTDYAYPEHQLPVARSIAWEYIDTLVLIIVLSVTTWLALKKRSRQGLVWTSLFSLAYFGFFREGCICSVGSVQNVSLALFNTGYTIPLTALLFFIIPLVFAIFYGRVFCAGACPLGAIQELTGIWPQKLPRRVEAVLATIPFIYLALAVLFSATRSQFIICRYDPFVGIFRLDAPYTMVIFGALLLLAGVVINRPYCRFLCPYGVLLNVTSRFASKHLSITPAECINCRLCENACPYDAILPADKEIKKEEPAVVRRKFITYLVLIPVFAAAGAFAFHRIAPVLSGASYDVKLAREIRLEMDEGIPALSSAAVAFKGSGTTDEQLFTNEAEIITRYRKASPWAGLFLGLSLGIGLFSLAIRTERTDYRPHQGKCYSCGRCFKYCPVEPKNKLT